MQHLMEVSQNLSAVNTATNTNKTTQLMGIICLVNLSGVLFLNYDSFPLFQLMELELDGWLFNLFLTDISK